ncbi:MAG: hypothetical protein JWM93_1172 [Frankiales bacterium]|nr:hypothetical protein [Frankiales bacterium]
MPSTDPTPHVVPFWLQITLAIAAPVVALLGVFWATLRTTRNQRLDWLRNQQLDVYASYGAALHKTLDAALAAGVAVFNRSSDNAALVQVFIERHSECAALVSKLRLLGSPACFNLAERTQKEMLPSVVAVLTDLEAGTQPRRAIEPKDLSEIRKWRDELHDFLELARRDVHPTLRRSRMLRRACRS